MLVQCKIQDWQLNLNKEIVESLFLKMAKK